MAEAPPQTTVQSTDTETLYCTVHPKIETVLRCNKCNRPMCTRCAIRTPVGYRCKECVRGQQQIFFNATPLDLIIQGALSTILSIVAAALIGLIGGGLGWLLFIIAIPASTFAGTVIADLAYRASGKRRGRYTWLVVALGVVVGALIAALAPALLTALMLGSQYGMFMALAGGGISSIAWWIYVVAATIAAIGRMRLGR